MTEVLPRRERIRQETTAEIKQHAWAMMADCGAAELSLREVARRMGMAPSALYRYFTSRNDLLSALICDGFDAMADALRDAHDDAAGRGLDAENTWVAVSHGYRRWAIANPTEYTLIYATAIPDYVGSPETTAASQRSGEVLLDILEQFLAEGTIDLERIARDVDDEYADQLSEWSRMGGRNLAPAALAVAMRCWVALHGAINLEMNRHYPPPLKHSAAQFDAIITGVAHSFMT